MRIYNTLNHTVEPIVPLEPGTIRMYSCGPTVYRFVHVGNLRTFTMADWLRRALEYHGTRVMHIKNITDVGHMRQELLDRGEDKLIAQARREGKTSTQIAAFYTAAFREDERKLHILPAHLFPRATDHIPEMIAIIADLLVKDIAYEVDGNVFYDVTRFPDYGALSGNALTQALEGLHGDLSGAKRHPEDFPLWKRSEPGREIAWDSPWGSGFPGWHIECSAMAIKHLGPRFDLHTGGVDNIFPHHEDEIAQSEAHTGQRFVNYWVHAQHLLSDGLKMAKSTGNAYTLADVEARGFDPLALRYFFTTAKYRSRINFTFSALRAAQTGLERLRLALLALAEQAGPQLPPLAHLLAAETGITEARDAFIDAVEDDLNIPTAMKVVWSVARHPAQGLSPAARLALLLDFDRILGLGLAEWLAAHHQPGMDGSQQVPGMLPQVHEAVVARSAARASGDYVRADALRATIAELGYSVRDTGSGPLVQARRPDAGLQGISRASDAPDHSAEPDRYRFSVNLLAHNSRGDLQRCIQSILAQRHGRSTEIVIVDNASTDDTLAYVRTLARAGLGPEVGLQVLFADHDMGFAAGRNAGTRTSLGRIVIWLDTSIELAGDIWTPLEHLLADRSIGVVGPYGLVTEDLKEFQEHAGPEVDAVEGYLMAFRRALVPEVGPAEERFRFYRLLDIYQSFMFKTSGYRVVRSAALEAGVVKHPHREWYSLSEEEQRTKSKHNYDLFRRRWHHGQSLLQTNFVAADRWPGHDHPWHLGGTHTHTPRELPLASRPHSHTHQHWPDHAHAHLHYHVPVTATASARGRDSHQKENS